MEQSSPTYQNSQIQESVYELNGKRFYRSSFFDIACIRCENGYYNFTKIAQDNGKRDIYEITRYKYWKDYIDAFKRSYLFDSETNEFILRISCTAKPQERYIEISDEMLSFTIQTRDEKLLELNGTYMPEDLLHFFCEHVNKTYSLKIAETIKLTKKETKLRNITLEQKIEEQEALIESLKTRLRNSNAGFNHETPGAIVIHETKTHNFKLFYKVVNVRAEDYPNDNVISEVYNIDKMKSLINFYAKRGYIADIKLIGSNVFEGTIESLTKLINELQHFKFRPSYNIDEEIRKYVDANRDSIHDKNKRNKAIGTLFEFYCAKRFSIPMYKLATVEMLSFSKQDNGVDLIDIDKLTIAQCKYYQSSELLAHRLQTFVDFCKYMNDWNRILFVNSNIKLSVNVVRASIQGLFEIMPIENYEFEGFLRSFGIELNNNSSISKDAKSLNQSYEVSVGEQLGNELSRSERSCDASCDTRYTSVRYTNVSEQSKSLNQSYEVNEIINANITKIANKQSVIKEYIKEQLELNDYLFLDELIAQINELRDENDDFKQELPIPLNRKTFYKRFADLYEHAAGGALPKIDDRAIVRKAINKEAELEFIRSTIADGEIELDEYINLHNSNFGTSYNRRSFTHRFSNLFQMQGKSLYSRRVNGKKVSYLRLKIEADENSKILSDSSETNTSKNKGFGIIDSTNASIASIAASITATLTEREPTMNKGIADYLNRELRAHDYLEVEETVNYIREHFDSTFSSRELHKTYKSLFAHEANGGLAKRRGRRVLILNVNKEDEINFIKENVVDEPSVSDYITIHNSHFGTHYTTKSFTHRFSKLFQMQGKELCYRQINNIRIPFLRLL